LPHLHTDMDGMTAAALSKHWVRGLREIPHNVWKKDQAIVQLSLVACHRTYKIIPFFSQVQEILVY